MQDLVIIGVGGFGRECCQWIEDVNADRATFRVLGFLDDDVSKHGRVVHDLEVLGGIAWLAHHRAAVVLGVGTTEVKRSLVERIRSDASDFPIVRHPRAVIGRFVEIGEGTVICPDVILTTDIHVGRFVTLNIDCTIGHDSWLGDYATLAPGVHLSGYSKILEGVNLGSGVTSVPGVEVGAWTVVGASAAIARSLPAHATAVGVPARVIKQRES